LIIHSAGIETLSGIQQCGQVEEVRKPTGNICTGRTTGGEGADAVQIEKQLPRGYTVEL
jgi:hypothetical protein